MVRKSFIALLGLLLTTNLSHAENISGRASVIDADTLEIRGQRIRLHAIDAPESSQICRDSIGRNYRCGQAAAFALADLIGAQNITCEPIGIDRYQRVIARCYLATLDINSWLVEQGHALAYRRYGTDYVLEENRAETNRRGMWDGEFVPPWDWRRGTRL